MFQNVPVLNLNNSKNTEQKDKIRSFRKTESCSGLMIKSG